MRLEPCTSHATCKMQPTKDTPTKRIHPETDRPGKSSCKPILRIIEFGGWITPGHPVSTAQRPEPQTCGLYVPPQELLFFESLPRDQPETAHLSGGTHPEMFTKQPSERLPFELGCGWVLKHPAACLLLHPCWGSLKGNQRN